MTTVFTDNATGIVYRVNPEVTNEALNALFATAWANHRPTDFEPVWRHSLAYICAYTQPDERLIGFINLAWDGGIHAFLLNPTVHSDFQRRGIGRELVECSARVAQERGVEWLHVDYEPHLHAFYAQCGFHPTLAGLRNLKRE